MILTDEQLTELRAQKGTSLHGFDVEEIVGTIDSLRAEVKRLKSPTGCHDVEMYYKDEPLVLGEPDKLPDSELSRLRAELAEAQKAIRGNYVEPAGLAEIECRFCHARQDVNGPQPIPHKPDCTVLKCLKGETP